MSICPICEEYEGVRSSELDSVKVKVCEPCRTQLEKERL